MYRRGPLAILKAISEGRFFSLLIFLLLYIGFSPLFYSFVRLRPLNDLFFTAVLVSGIYAVSKDFKHTIIAMGLAMPMLAVTWLLNWYHHKAVAIAGVVFGILFIGYTAVSIFIFILHAREVTRHVIFAAVSVYLLMGLLWSLIYGALELLNPDSFKSIAQGFKAGQSFFLYFSFVTLTTLGYGDIVPVSPQARSLSVLEAVVGQLYLAVLVARLVGIHISKNVNSQKS